MLRSITFTAAALLSTAAIAQDLPQADNEWFTAAQETIQRQLALTPNTNRALNVILLVADGQGVGTNYAARLYAGQQAGGFGDEYIQPQEAFPYAALVKTYSTNGQTPDSAPTATAMNSGIKTKNDLINITENVAVGDCAAGLENGVTTFAEIVAEQGKSVGVISTARITHATPAAAYARTANRDWEDNTSIPEGCAQKDIATQLFDMMQAGTVDLAMGGGRQHFIPEAVTDAEGSNGNRTDDRNLAQEVVDAGGAYVQNTEEFAALDLTSDAPVLGLFEPSHMQYEADRDGEPSLAEMTAAAITKLSANENGYYLEIEAGRVDHANHAGNLARVLIDAKAFADAVAMADEMTDDADTLIIVTADHEHALAFNGYCGRGSDILGLCMQINEEGIEHLAEPNTASDGKPYTVAGFLNGPGSVLIEQAMEEAETSASGTTDVGAAEGEPQPIYSGERPDVTNDEATDLDYIQQALVPLSSETHSGEDVAVYAKGPFAHLLEGTVEQNVIFHVMHHAAIVAE